MDKFIARARTRRQEFIRKKRIKKIILFSSFFLIGSIIFLILFFNINRNNNAPSIIQNTNPLVNTADTTQNNNEIKKQSVAKLSFVGNIICNKSQTKDAFNSNKYDYSYIFEKIIDYISKSDLTIGTLETNFAVTNQNSYDDFNTPNSFANNLKDIGFDILLTATDHALDENEAGVKSTLALLDNIRHFTYRNI